MNMTPPDDKIRAYFEAQGWTISMECWGRIRKGLMFCKRGKKIPFNSLAQAWRIMGP